MSSGVVDPVHANAGRRTRGHLDGGLGDTDGVDRNERACNEMQAVAVRRSGVTGDDERNFGGGRG